MTEFEKQLSQQPLRRPPPGWKQEILRAAEAVLDVSPSPLAASNSRASWLEMFWPSPRAWAGLAVVWMLTIGLYWNTEQMAAASYAGRTRLDPRMVAAFLERQRIAVRALESDRDLAEPIDRPKPIPRRS